MLLARLTKETEITLYDRFVSDIQLRKTMITHTETSRPSNIAASKIPRITSRQEELVGESDVAGPVPAMLKFKSILVPIDFSRISRKALDYAVPLAKHFGAKITLLHAIEPLPTRRI